MMNNPYFGIGRNFILKWVINHLSKRECMRRFLNFVWGWKEIICGLLVSLPNHLFAQGVSLRSEIWARISSYHFPDFQMMSESRIKVGEKCGAASVKVTGRREGCVHPRSGTSGKILETLEVHEGMASINDGVLKAIDIVSARKGGKGKILCSEKKRRRRSIILSHLSPNYFLYNLISALYSSKPQCDSATKLIIPFSVVLNVRSRWTRCL